MQILEVIEVINTLSARQLFICILGTIWFLSILNAALILPLLFNFKIIPEIEKKIGQRLVFDKLYNAVFFFGNYFVRFTEISLYIVLKYFKISFLRMKRSALAKVNYTRENFSKLEIFWSFFAIINYIIGLGLTFLLPNL